MAKRRMFSTDIIDSDSFLEMPLSCRCLYYDLGMRADDDGFVSPNKVVRVTGASSDDLKVLSAKKFIIPFESGVIVIKDWKMNNYIQSDRYTETIYKNEKKLLVEDENKSYRLENPENIQNVYKLDTQVRLGKDRLGKYSKDIILKDNTQKRDNPIKGDKLVNKVIEEFEEALGFKPTDRKPRYQAYNLVRRLQAIIKDNGKEANEEVSLKAINSYFKWLKKQDWFGLVQTLDTCRRKTDIFVHDYNLK